MEARYILLVEDDPNDEALALRAFKKGGNTGEIVVVSDGVQARDYMLGTGSYSTRDLNAAPAVVLLDLKMPKVDGLEVLRTLREDERTRNVPVVIFTSSKEEQDLVTGYALGANSYIRKPVDFDQFAEVVRQVGTYWLVLNEPPPPPGRVR